MDPGPPGLGAVILLQKQNAGPLSQNKAAALPVKGDGGPGRVVPSVQGLHGGKAADGQGGDHALGPATEHHVGVAVPDLPEGVAHRVGAPGAGGDRAGTHALKAVPDGDEPGGHVADGHGDIKGRDSVEALGLALHQLLHRDGQPADAAGDDDAAAQGVLPLHVQPAVRYGLLGRRHRKLGKSGHMLGLPPVHPGRGVEILYLCAQLDLLVFRVILGDGADAAHPVLHRLPGLGYGVAQRGDTPQSGDDDPSFSHRTNLLHTAMPPSTQRTWPVR